jgi:hypothetical protein
MNSTLDLPFPCHVNINLMSTHRTTSQVKSSVKMSTIFVGYLLISVNDGKDEKAILTLLQQSETQGRPSLGAAPISVRSDPNPSR